MLWSGEDDALRAVRAADPDAVIIAHDFGTDLAPTMINMDGSGLVVEDIERAHAEGLGMSVWTIDTAEAMRWLIRHGVDSITTNRVDLALRVRAEQTSDPAQSARPG